MDVVVPDALSEVLKSMQWRAHVVLPVAVWMGGLRTCGAGMRVEREPGADRLHSGMAASGAFCSWVDRVVA